MDKIQEKLLGLIGLCLFAMLFVFVILKSGALCEAHEMASGIVMAVICICIAVLFVNILYNMYAPILRSKKRAGEQKERQNK